MKKTFLALIALICMIFSAAAQKQLTPPRIMIVPDLVFCKTNGYTLELPNASGGVDIVPDYERALSEDPSLHAVLTQVAQLITDRDGSIVVTDLTEAINGARTDAALSAGNDGDVSESIDEAIIRNSNADILVKVQYDLVKNGPQYQVSYTLRGTDPYTNYMFAPVEGMGAPSTSASPVALLREAVYSNMDPFLDKMLGYYRAMYEGGRMVAFDIKTTNSSSWNMNSPVGPYVLREVIEDFLYDNSVEGKGLENVRGGNTFLQYQGVYIPLVSTIRGRQRKQSAKDVAQKLVNYLAERGVQAEFKILGLGKVNIFIN